MKSIEYAVIDKLGSKVGCGCMQCFAVFTFNINVKSEKKIPRTNIADIFKFSTFKIDYDEKSVLH